MGDNASHPETSPPEMESVGKFLQRERIKQQKTLKEVATETCIHLTTLQALEEDDRRKLPAEVFVRGFISIYAQYLGLNAQEALNLYGERSSANWKRPGSDQKQKLISTQAPRRPAPGRLLVVTLVLVVGGLLLYWGSRTWQTGPLELPVATEPRGELDSTVAGVPAAVAPTAPAEPAGQSDPVAEPRKIRVPAPVEETAPETVVVPAPITISPPPEVSPAQPTSTAPADDLQPQVEPTATDLSAARDESAPAVPETPPAADTPAYVLQAQFTETTWVQSQTDGQPAREFTFQPGERYTWEAATDLKLFFGNAGGVELILNDQPLPAPGKSGQTARISFPDQP